MTDDKTIYAILNTCVVVIIIMTIVAIASFVHYVFSINDTHCTSSINDTHYVIEAKVVDINTATDTVQIEDTHGEVWEFFGVNNFQKNDSIIALMDNQGTSTIYDDEILSVRPDPFNP